MIDFTARALKGGDGASLTVRDVAQQQQQSSHHQQQEKEPSVHGSELTVPKGLNYACGKAELQNVFVVASNNSHTSIFLICFAVCLILTGMVTEMHCSAEINEIFKTEDIVVVYFSANWCKNCKKMSPFLDEKAAFYAEKGVFLKVDIATVS